MINGILTVLLLGAFLLNMKEASITSDIRIHYKHDVLLIGIAIFLLQAILNSRRLNQVIQQIVLILIAYVMYTYIYSFFDPHDFWMKQENGLFVKTVWTGIKLGLVGLFGFLIHLIKPVTKNPSQL